MPIRMTHAQLKERLTELGFDSRQKDITAARERQIAMLLYDSGYSARELAEVVCKSHQWVAQQIKFAKYLRHCEVSTMVDTPENQMSTMVDTRLSERRFRMFWVETCADDSDEDRFAAVCRLRREAVAQPSKMLVSAVMAEYGDGKWHPLDKIAEKVNAGSGIVAKAMKEIERKFRANVETKTVGTRPHYRIFRRDRATDKMVSLLELIEKCGPDVDALLAEGKKNMATMSPGTVAHHALRIKRQFDDWSA